MSTKLVIGLLLIGLFLGGTFAYTWRLLKYLNRTGRGRIDPSRLRRREDDDDEPGTGF